MQDSNRSKPVSISFCVIVKLGTNRAVFLPLFSTSTPFLNADSMKFANVSASFTLSPRINPSPISCTKILLCAFCKSCNLRVKYAIVSSKRPLCFSLLRISTQQQWIGNYHQMCYHGHLEKKYLSVSSLQHRLARLHQALLP